MLAGVVGVLVEDFGAANHLVTTFSGIVLIFTAPSGFKGHIHAFFFAVEIHDRWNIRTVNMCYYPYLQLTVPNLYICILHTHIYIYTYYLYWYIYKTM